MKDLDHLEKARKIEKSLAKLSPPNDLELFTEGIFGAAQHYIAYATQTKIEKHLDSHEGLSRFLRDNGFEDTSELFNAIDIIRQGRWYGRKGDSETAKQLQKLLEQIKKWATT
jgi:hypothetical protein